MNTCVQVGVSISNHRTLGCSCRVRGRGWGWFEGGAGLAAIYKNLFKKKKSCRHEREKKVPWKPGSFIPTYKWLNIWPHLCLYLHSWLGIITWTSLITVVSGEDELLSLNLQWDSGSFYQTVSKSTSLELYLLLRAAHPPFPPRFLTERQRQKQKLLSGNLGQRTDQPLSINCIF